jgi:hypothetical protein
MPNAGQFEVRTTGLFDVTVEICGFVIQQVLACKEVSLPKATSF